MSLTTGSHLAQRYRLARRIAVGGMGEVWEAEDTRLGRQVAIKVLKQELTGDPEFRARFHTEARTTASLNHPGIAAVHDYGEVTTAAGPHGYPAEIAYLVMELVDGDSLAAVLTRQPRLGADQTLDILGQASDALQAAHERGLVHRDVKPGNILITPTGRVKLTDFGIAKAVDSAPVTRQGMVMGTAHYIAPEQAAGTEAGPASDIYSLGVVGYECLAGRRPFQAENPLTVAMMHVSDPPPPLPPEVPPAIRALIDATLVKDPRQRYRNGAEFGSAVATVRAGHGPAPGAGSSTAQAPTVAVPTTAMGGHHPTRTALLAPGAGDEGPPPDPPRTGRAPRVPAGEPPPKRRSGARTAIVVALLGALVVVLGAYSIREALRAGDGQPPGATSVAPDGEQPGPAPAAPAPEEPEPQAPAPQPDQDDQGGDRGGDQSTDDGEPTATTEDEPEEVFVVPTDYLGKSGSAAATAAEENNLRPQVVDEDGNEVDSDQQSQCRVSAVDPAAGFVPPGSTLELTCGGSG